VLKGAVARRGATACGGRARERDEAIAVCEPPFAGREPFAGASTQPEARATRSET